jgi:hypothetical protein
MLSDERWLGKETWWKGNGMTREEGRLEKEKRI